MDVFIDEALVDGVALLCGLKNVKEAAAVSMLIGGTFDEGGAVLRVTAFFGNPRVEVVLLPNFTSVGLIETTGLFVFRRPPCNLDAL